MAEDNEKIPEYQLRDNGEVHRNKKGKSQLLAKYDEETGILTFESFSIDQKYRMQICRAVMENWESGELTGNPIKAYAIAGRPVDTIKPGEPPPPKKNKMLGDKTPEYVKWLKRWRPQAFYARYGVLLDSNGEPQIAECFRMEQGLLKPAGAKPLEIGDRAQDALGQTITEKEDGILAMRATCLTFTKKEVVGYEDDEEQDEDEPIAGQAPTPKKADEDEEPEPVPGGRKGRKGKANEDDEA